MPAPVSVISPSSILSKFVLWKMRIYLVPLSSSRHSSEMSSMKEFDEPDVVGSSLPVEMRPPMTMLMRLFQNRFAKRKE